MDYKISSHSVYNINYHIVFCPKRRKKCLVEDIATTLKDLFQQIADRNSWSLQAVEVMPDHVHIFVGCSTKDSPHKIVKTFKGGTARIMRDTFPQLRKIPAMWSNSYYCGTIGNVSATVVKSYIANQKGK